MRIYCAFSVTFNAIADASMAGANFVGILAKYTSQSTDSYDVIGSCPTTVHVQCKSLTMFTKLWQKRLPFTCISR